MRIGMPCSANSSSQKVRARKPRSSARRSISIRYAPSSRVGRNCMARSAHHRDRRLPAQVLAQPARLLQLADAVDAQVPGADELVEGQPVADVRLVELLDAAAHGPLRLELRQDAGDLRAVDLIGAL